MAKRLTTEDHLARLRELRAAPASDRATAALAELLGSPRLHGLVLKGAAELAARYGAKGLVDALVEAALAVAPPPEGAKRDPGCTGKGAVLRTLLEWEADVPEFFVQAAAWVQQEPAHKGTVDTAAECRGLAAVGIAQTRPENAIVLMVDLLADKQEATRIYAAMALGVWRGPESLPMLRFKARSGDESAEVMGEVLSALLQQDPRGQFALVAGFLDDAQPRVIEVAALALGRSRLEEALEPLTATFGRYQRHPIHTSVLMGIALLRSEASFEWLLKRLDAEGLGMDVLEALRIYRGDARATDRIRPLAKKHPETAAAFHQLFE